MRENDNKTLEIQRVCSLSEGEK